MAVIRRGNLPLLAQLLLFALLSPCNQPCSALQAPVRTMKHSSYWKRRHRAVASRRHGLVPNAPVRLLKPGKRHHRAAAPHSHELSPSVNASSLSTAWNAGRLLAAVVYWKQKGKPHEQHLRLEALKRTLKALHSYSVETDVILVTNAHVPEVSTYVWEEVLRPSPRCSVGGKQDNLCLPWEALRLLRLAALTGEVADNATAPFDPSDTDWLPQLKTYDYYIYIEEDILLGKESFEFWKEHADEAFDRGYYLLPQRRELRHGQWMLSDYNRPGFGCARHTVPIVDRSGDSSDYLSFEDRIYILPGCPYTAMFALTKRQFAEWLSLKMWDYKRMTRISRWDVRERATIGLMVFTDTGGFSYDVASNGYTPITHLKLWVKHQMPFSNKRAGTRFASFPLFKLRSMVHKCEAHGGKRTETGCQEF